jgi:hypothetical protein
VEIAELTRAGKPAFARFTLAHSRLIVEQSHRTLKEVARVEVMVVIMPDALPLAMEPVVKNPAYQREETDHQY